MLENFEARMAVSWDDEEGIAHYGVVMSVGDQLEVAEVRPATRDVKCYDEGGAVYERDKDNVRLTEYPPFSLLRLMSEVNSCFVLASSMSRNYFDVDDVVASGMYVLDDGTKICESDFRAILDHSWRDEKERGLWPGEMASVRFDMQHSKDLASSPAYLERKVPSSLARLIAVAGTPDRATQKQSDDYEYGG